MRIILYFSIFLQIICSVSLHAQDSIVVLQPKKSTLQRIKTKVGLGIGNIAKKTKKRKKKKQSIAENTTETQPVTAPPVAIKRYEVTLEAPEAKEEVVEQKRNTQLQHVRMATTFESGLADHPSLQKIDQAWKDELIKNYHFEDLQTARLAQNYNLIEYVSDLPTEVLKERLAVLNAKTPFNIEYNPHLESVIKSYLKNRKNTMSKLMALSEYFFPMFEEVLAKYDLPLEIKYLAIVESALKPNAKSRVGATGLWQFMYGTGKMYDLNVSSYVDERMDPIKSTEAAALYLSKLYETFEDWDLALAAYNSGPGNVTKAIRRSGGYNNFWGIRHFLPRETAGYVPAFLATLYLFEYADAHGMTSEPANFRYFTTDTVQVQKQISLKHVAQHLQMSNEELTFLNPSYKLGIIPKLADKTYSLRLPTEKVGVFLSHEYAIYDQVEKEIAAQKKPLPEYVSMNKRVRYRIRNGDNLGSIAERFGVSVSQIKSWNNLRSSRIGAGKYLTIYPRKVDAYLASNTKTSSKRNGKKTYTVQPGDTLWSISKKYAHLDIKKLKSLNNLRSSSLKPGMVLQIR